MLLKKVSITFKNPILTQYLLELRESVRFHAINLSNSTVQKFTDKEWRNPLH